MPDVTRVIKIDAIVDAIRVVVVKATKQAAQTSATDDKTQTKRYPTGTQNLVNNREPRETKHLSQVDYMQFMGDIHSNQTL